MKAAVASIGAGSDGGGNGASSSHLAHEGDVRVRHLEPHRTRLQLLERDALGEAALREDRLDRLLGRHVEVLREERRIDALDELLPHPELGLGLAPRRDRLLLDLQVRVQRRRREVALLVPGGGRQHDVGPLRRVGHLVVDHHDQLAAVERLVQPVHVHRLQEHVGEGADERLEPVLGIRDRLVHRLGAAAHEVDAGDDGRLDVAERPPGRGVHAHLVLADVDGEPAAGAADVAGEAGEQREGAAGEVAVEPVVAAAAHDHGGRALRGVAARHPDDGLGRHAGDLGGALRRPAVELLAHEREARA